MEDYAEWCDEHLPDLYNPGLFDDEETTDDVWEAVHTVANKTILAYIDDEVERETVTDALMDVAADWFRAHRDMEIDALEALTPDELQMVLGRPQTSQHSSDWYNQRRNRLTASEFSNILCGSRQRLLLSKLDTSAGERSMQAPVAIAQSDGEMVATSWGHRFEPIVRAIYELEIAGVDTVCDTLGRFTHQEHPWLSASPDGIVMKGALAGRLLEIKAPKTRQPDTYVPHDYYVQMQVQMEVCDLEAVDFVEAQFGQLPIILGAEDAGEQQELYAEAAAAAEGMNWKGWLAVYGLMEDPSTWVYSYSKPVEDLRDARLPGAPGLPLLERTVWWLKGWFPRTVLRNRSWWAETGWPAAELFWTQVVSARAQNVVTTNEVTTNEVTTNEVTEHEVTEHEIEEATISYWKGSA